MKKLNNLSPKVSNLVVKAKKASLRSNYSKFMIGSVIVKQGRIISCGWSQLKTHPYVKYNGVYQKEDGVHISENMHSELASVFKVKDKRVLQGTTIYIYRENKNGHFANCKPCPMCHKILKEYGVKKMIYTTDQGLIEELV